MCSELLITTNFDGYKWITKKQNIYPPPVFYPMCEVLPSVLRSYILAK